MPFPRLWRDRDFLRLLAGQTASQFAAQAAQLTLPLVAVLTLGAGAGQVGALRAAQQVPVLVLSLFVGVAVDRWRVRDLMVLADAGRALVLAAVPLAYLVGMLDLRVLFVVSVLVGVCTACFDVAYQAAAARLIGVGRLAQATGMLESSRSAAQMGGPALGGAMVSLLSGPVAVAGSAVLYVLSSLSIARVRPDAATPGDGSKRAVRDGMRDGLRLVARDATLRAIGVASASYQFFFAAFMTLYLLFLPRTLHLSGAAVGLALGALGPGTLAGSLLAATLPRRFGYGVVLVTSAAVADAVLLCVPALHGSGARTTALLVLVGFLFGTFSQTVDVAVMTVRQAVTPAAIQGRVAATLHVTGVGLAPLGSLLGGALAAHLGPRTGLLLASAGLWLSPLCMASSPLARLGRALPGRVDEPGPKAGGMAT